MHALMLWCICRTKHVREASLHAQAAPVQSGAAAANAAADLLAATSVPRQRDGAPDVVQPDAAGARVDAGAATLAELLPTRNSVAGACIAAAAVVAAALVARRLRT